jgi:hypothetical protein
MPVQEKVCVRACASDECVRALGECALDECPQAGHQFFRMLLCISAVKQFCIRANTEKKCEEHTELGPLEYVAKRIVTDAVTFIDVASAASIGLGLLRQPR